MHIGILYLVATPIGNLEDLTPRAARILQEVDFIAAEDTRVSQKLLFHLGCKKPMISYYQHNQRQRGEEILQRLLAGESCALVTDAGTPAISDPGEDLVALCAAQSIPVVPIPGACAAVCALSASGLPSMRWCFEGFLPISKKERRLRLQEIALETRTMILYEAPHKLKATLADLAQVCGNERNISLSRELTKLHEETLRFTLLDAMSFFAEHDPRGEFVLVLEGTTQTAAEDTEETRMLCAVECVKQAMLAGESLKDAVKAAAQQHDVRKNTLYQLMLKENNATLS